MRSANIHSPELLQTLENELSRILYRAGITTDNNAAALAEKLIHLTAPAWGRRFLSHPGCPDTALPQADATYAYLHEKWLQQLLTLDISSG